MVACVVVAIVAVVYFLSSSTSSGENRILENQTPNIIKEDSRSLVVYFSVLETDDPNNMTRDEENSTVVIDGKMLGNTEYVATLISERTNSDLFRLEPVEAYPTNHQDLLRRAQEEMQNDVKPELKENIDISNYDVIFIGYPIWNADLPPIINTFLENNDFSGKTVIPFCTHGGSVLSRTPQTIKNKLNNATVITNGFEIYRTNMEDSPSEIEAWLNEVGFN